MISQSIIAALLLAQAAPKAAEPCITKQEAGDLAVVALPLMVDEAARRCNPHVAAGSFLRTGALAFSQRLRADGAGRRESALRALQRMLGQPAATGPVADLILQTMVSGMMSGLDKNLNAASCAELSGVVEALSPLPSANVAQLVGSSLGFFRAISPEGGPPICRS